MQTDIRSYRKFADRLPELQKKWADFPAKQLLKNENILIFNKRNFQIKSTRYWFYLLHTAGAECWNLFVEYCIQEDGNFRADFSGFIFDEPINFEGFNLENVDFSNSFFEVPANFKGAKFYKTANFSTSTFKHEVDFQDAYFEHAIFAHSRFQSTANFNKSQFQEVNFNQAVFQKIANFSEASFKKLYFAGTVFPPYLDFSRAIFSQELNIRESDLQQVENILFEKTKFLNQENFQKCNFPVVNFSGAEFQQEVDFSQAHFQKKAIFTETKFLQEAKFLNTIFHQEIFFFNVIFEKKTSFESSVFHQNANFQGLQPKKEIYFNDTHFKAEAIFRNYHLRNFTSFKKACFEQLAEFGIDEKYDMQLIDFTEVQMHFSPKSKWTTKYTTLLKIQQLRHLAWRLKNKKLNRKLSQLERLARRGVKLKQLLSQMKNFWQIDKKKRGFLGYFFRFIFFIFFVIPWGIRFLLFWPLGQLSIFFYGTKNHNNYIRSLFFLVLSYPIFYFLYTQTSLLQEGTVLGNCSRIQAYNFTLQHYLPFVDNWTFVNNWNSITPYFQKCFANTIPITTYNIVIAQSIFSLLLACFTLLPLLETIFNRIRFATKKTSPSDISLIPEKLNPTEETATLTLPDSDTTSIALDEQLDPKIRKIRDEDIIDSPDIAQPVKIPVTPHQPIAQPVKIPVTPHQPIAQPVKIPVTPHQPYLFVPDPNFNSKKDDKQVIHYEENFKKRFSLRWPHPFLKSFMKKNNIQETEIITQMNKAQETSQTKERESIGGEESLRGEAEFYREKAEQQQQQIQTPPADTDALKEGPVVLHRTSLEREKEKYKYSKDKIDRIRQIRSMSSNMFKR